MRRRSFAVIKDSKLKAQASIQGDTVRVVSKDRDVLQQIMGKLRGGDFGVESSVHQLPLQLAGIDIRGTASALEEKGKVFGAAREPQILRLRHSR